MSRSLLNAIILHNRFSSNVPHDRLACRQLLLADLSLFQSLAAVLFVFCQVPESFIVFVSLIDFARMLLHWNLNFVLGGFSFCRSGPFYAAGLLPDSFQLLVFSAQCPGGETREEDAAIT